MSSFICDRGNSITVVLGHGALLALMKCSSSVNVILILLSQETSHLWGFETHSEMHETKSESKTRRFSDGNSEALVQVCHRDLIWKAKNHAE